MASSRWKRFGFFDRKSLNLPSEVLEDLILPNQGPSNGGRVESVGQVVGDSELSIRDSISLVMSTAGLPLSSKPLVQENDTASTETALSGMWSTLTACSPIDLQNERSTIQLPNQSLQSFDGNSTAGAEKSSVAMDGLVLIFAASRNTDFVHCFDVTVRCNPPDNLLEKDLEDMDGWRGYFAPMRNLGSQQESGARTTEDRIINEHLDARADRQAEGIVGISTCRNQSGQLHMACISNKDVVVCVDPHLSLSCRRPMSLPKSFDSSTYKLSSSWSVDKDGEPRAVDVTSGIVAVGTSKGCVHIFTYSDSHRKLQSYLKIPAPPTADISVISCKLSLSKKKVSVFVAYQRVSSVSSPRSTAGLCCYDMPIPSLSSTSLSAPSARHDLDGRYVPSSSLCDAPAEAKGAVQFTVARSDGIYTYSETHKTDVSPIDGSKLAVCVLPSPFSDREDAPGRCSYALVASTDVKSRRDAVDIYDSSNKLVAFHLLLSPGHKAIRAAAVTTPATVASDGALRAGRASAVVLTSGGSLVTLTEKETTEKVRLLVQKNLYSAAAFIAYADPSYDVSEITSLYQKHAEHLYRKGDFSGSIDQYILTIGSLEPSHVIFRFLDAPKIPLLVKYLEELRTRELATPVHNDLLRTCYLKLNDEESAETIAASSSRSLDTGSLSTIVGTSPKDALATICSFEAPQAVEALLIHGGSLARLLPRETAGLVVSLCLGTYSPDRLLEVSESLRSDTSEILEFVSKAERACDPYPLHLFASSFMENPKVLRLILCHCNRNKCPLTPSLRRSLLELTLEEWNQAKRVGDTESEKLRRKEAIAALTDSHCRELGDHDALVIVQLAGFEEGELLILERLRMKPMLLRKYAEDGNEKARRQMVAMCQNDPEILGDVLGHFVNMVSTRLATDNQLGIDPNTEYDHGSREILEDIQEVLLLARQQGVLPPVRIARILAGECTGQFASPDTFADSSDIKTVPLEVALDYVGEVLDGSNTEIARLKSEVEEYNQLCQDMEKEVDCLLRNALPRSQAADTVINGHDTAGIDIQGMFAKVRVAMEEGDPSPSMKTADLSREAFWREMEKTDDSFEIIARYFTKGVIQ